MFSAIILSEVCLAIGLQPGAALAATPPATAQSQPSVSPEPLSAFPEWMRAPHLDWMRASHQFYTEHSAPHHRGLRDWADDPGPKLTGVVLRPDGKPLEEAEVIICHTMQSADLRADSMSYTGPAALTDEQGRFVLPAPPPAMIWDLAVWHERGYVELSSRELDQSRPLTIRTRAWGRLEIDFRSGTQPAPKRWITMLFHAPCAAYINYWYSGTTDDRGHLVFERIRPGVVTMYEPSQIPIRDGSRQLRNRSLQVTIKPGETTRVTLGGTGRPVVARIKLAPHVDWEDVVSVCELSPANPDPPYPAGLDEARKKEWSAKWSATPEGEAVARVYARCGEFAMSDPARLRIEDVPAGAYRLVIKYFEPPEEEEPGSPGAPKVQSSVPLLSFPDKLIGKVTRSFTVPDMPGGRSDEPLDLGALELDSPSPATRPDIASQPAPSPARS